MEHSLFAVRASIVSAMEYLASARLEVPCAAGAPDGTASIYRAEALLRRALGDLPAEVDMLQERRDATRRATERGTTWAHLERRRA